MPARPAAAVRAAGNRPPAARVDSIAPMSAGKARRAVGSVSRRAETQSTEDGGTLPRLSRALLLPGPLPPNSHFGVTLLRHVVGTGLRSALHRLGLPLLPAPPVRIVALRLYLDRDALARGLGDAAGAAEAIGALVDPGGVAAPSTGGARLAGAGLLHRFRLRRPAPLRPPQPAGGPPLEEFRAILSALLPALSDAFLAELLASLSRRRERAAGRPRPPCLGREAARVQRGEEARLQCLGPPEPLLASWASGGVPEAASDSRPAACRRQRGRFREQYRAALDLLAPSYRRLAEEATGRGLLDDPSDAFFLPLDLAADLDADRRPDWLAPAVAANRREYISCRTRPSPPDQIDPDSDTAAPPEAWDLCPLNPLP